MWLLKIECFPWIVFIYKKKKKLPNANSNLGAIFFSLIVSEFFPLVFYSYPLIENIFGSSIHTREPTTFRKGELKQERRICGLEIKEKERRKKEEGVSSERECRWRCNACDSMRRTWVKLSVVPNNFKRELNPFISTCVRRKKNDIDLASVPGLIFFN